MKKSNRLISCCVLFAFILPVLSISVNADNEFSTLSRSSSELSDLILSTPSELDTDNDGLFDYLEYYAGTNPKSPDTDSDGVNDYTECYITHTNPLIADGNIDIDGDGLTNSEEAALGTHPADPDIDGDGLPDGVEVTKFKTDPLLNDSDSDGLLDGEEVSLKLNPLAESTDGITFDTSTIVGKKYIETQRIDYAENDTNMTPVIDVLAVGDDTDYDGLIGSDDSNTSSNSFSAKLYTDYATSSVFYNMDYRWFFSSNTTYNSGLSRMSSLLSSVIYAENKINVLTGGTLTTTASTAIKDWMEFHGMSHVVQRNISSSTDSHISEICIGHREITYGSSTKNIVCVVIRGTNGTIEEWSSNFDVGATTESNTNWTTKTNHKGFDITANRINSYISTYLSTYCNGLDNVLWITGHSRGAALANLVAAKRIDSGFTVFAYTFASPTTTTSSTATATKYRCIFNIINTDDFVPYLPVAQWSFARFGVNKTASVADSYEVAWESLTGIRDYNPDSIGMTNTVDTLAETASSRNNCYVYRTDSTGYFKQGHSTEAMRNSLLQSKLDSYFDNMIGTYRYDLSYESDGWYYFKMYHMPAFFMQTLASVMAGEMSSLNFVALTVAPYLEDAKASVVFSYLGGLNHPHYTETYYLLAKNMT